MCEVAWMMAAWMKEVARMRGAQQDLDAGGGTDERDSANIQHGLHTECPSSWPSSVWQTSSGLCLQ